MHTHFFCQKYAICPGFASSLHPRLKLVECRYESPEMVAVFEVIVPNIRSLIAISGLGNQSRILLKHFSQVVNANESTRSNCPLVCEYRFQLLGARS